MDKILELGDVFGHLLGGGASNFNPVLLIPVLFVVVGAVSVFIYGFQRSEERPKFRKSTAVGDSSGGSTTKRKRRSPETTPAAASTKAVKTQKAEATIVSTSVKKHTEQSPAAGRVAVAAVDKKSSKNAAATPAKLSAVSNNKSKTQSAKSQAQAKTKKTENKLVNGLHAGILGAGDSGEWQTVLNKKQKKQAANAGSDPLIQAVAEVAAIAAGNSKNKLTTPNKNKVAAAANSSKKVKALEKLTHLENTAVDVVAAPLAVAPVVDEHADNIDVAPALKSNEPASVAVTVAQSVKEEVAASNSPVLAPVAAPESNVAFDELGEEAWTETKPQKKNKKRALRE